MDFASPGSRTYCSPNSEPTGKITRRMIDVGLPAPEPGWHWCYSFGGAWCSWKNVKPYTLFRMVDWRTHNVVALITVG